MPRQVLRDLLGHDPHLSGRAGCWLHPGLAAGSPADSPRPGLKIRQLALIHQPPVGQRPFVSFRAMGVSRVFGLAWPTVRLALKIPGFSAADHVESPTNPGRRRSAYVPTQPHQSMSSRLLLEEPVEELVEESRGSTPFLTPKQLGVLSIFWFWVRGPACGPKSASQNGYGPFLHKIGPNCSTGCCRCFWSLGSRARLRPQKREPTWLRPVPPENLTQNAARDAVDCFVLP